jgi:hypothetical protein
MADSGLEFVGGDGTSVASERSRYPLQLQNARFLGCSNKHHEVVRSRLDCKGGAGANEVNERARYPLLT